MNATRQTPSWRRRPVPAAGVLAPAPQPWARRLPGRRWLAAGAAAVAITISGGCSLRLLTGQGHAPIVTTPNDNSATNDAPAFQTMLSAGDGTLLVDLGETYWCTASSCVGGPSLAAWTDGPDNLPDAKPAPAPAIVFAGRDLMVVGEDSSGRTVTLTTCAAASGGHATEVRRVTGPGNPIVALGIGVPAGNLRILWSTQDTDFLGAIHYSGHLWIGNMKYP